MDLVTIHECLCDRTRLRIVQLLLGGSCCVCHLQEVLGEPQFKVSRHLAYLRERGMVTAERRGQWMVYALPRRRPRALGAHLACLQDCRGEDPVFRADLRRLAALRRRGASAQVSCASAPLPRGRTAHA